MLIGAALLALIAANSVLAPLYDAFRELAIANDPTVRRFNHPGQTGHQSRPLAEPRRAQAPVVVHHTYERPVQAPAAITR